MSYVTAGPAARTYTVNRRELVPVDRIARAVVGGKRSDPVLAHLSGRIERLSARLANPNTAKEARHVRRTITRLIAAMRRRSTC